MPSGCPLYHQTNSLAECIPDKYYNKEKSTEEGRYKQLELQLYAAITIKKKRGIKSNYIYIYILVSTFIGHTSPGIPRALSLSAP